MLTHINNLQRMSVPHCRSKELFVVSARNLLLPKEFVKSLKLSSRIIDYNISFAMTTITTAPLLNGQPIRTHCKSWCHQHPTYTLPMHWLKWKMPQHTQQCSTGIKVRMHVQRTFCFPKLHHSSKPSKLKLLQYGSILTVFTTQLKPWRRQNYPWTTFPCKAAILGFYCQNLNSSYLYLSS